jgi:hypothetical protein
MPNLLASPDLFVFGEDLWGHGFAGLDGGFDLTPVGAVVLGEVCVALGLAVVLILGAGHLPNGFDIDKPSDELAVFGESCPNVPFLFGSPSQPPVRFTPCPDQSVRWIPEHYVLIEVLLTIASLVAADPPTQRDMKRLVFCVTEGA